MVVGAESAIHLLLYTACGSFDLCGFHGTNIGYTMTTSRFSVYTKPTSGRSITDLYHGKRRC